MCARADWGEGHRHVCAALGAARRAERQAAAAAAERTLAVQGGA